MIGRGDPADTVLVPASSRSERACARAFCQPPDSLSTGLRPDDLRAGSRVSPVMSSTSRPALWTATFTALVISNLGVFLVFYMLASTVSGWAMTSLHTGSSTAGFIGTIYFLGAVVARLTAGRVSALVGERAVVLGSLLVLLVGCLAHPFVDTVGPLLVLRFVHGFAYGTAATGVTGVALSRAPVQRTGEASGWISFGMALATGLGPFVGVRLEHAAGETAVFWACTGCAVVALGAAFVAARDLRPRVARRGPQVEMLPRAGVPISLVVASCALGFGTMLTFVNPFGAAVGLSSASGFYFLVYALVICLSRPIAGVIQDRTRDTLLVAPCLVVAALGMIATSTAHGPVRLLLGAALLGLGYGTIVPVDQTVAVHRVGLDRATSAVAGYFCIVDGATGVGPFVLGSLVGPLGYRGAIGTGALLTLLGLASVPLLDRRTRAAAQ